MIILTVLGGACSTAYGPKGIGGGYSDKQINSTTYLLRYEGSILTGDFTMVDKLTPLWRKRAEELCSSKDFYYEYQATRINDLNDGAHIGTPVVQGVVFCNNKILDTRKQNNDSNFVELTSIPADILNPKDQSPLWDLLVTKNYSALQQEVQNLSTRHNIEDFAALLETFSRINPAAEDLLTGWVNSYPHSHYPLYARALFYHEYSWFKRGSSLGKDLTEEQRNGLNKYRALALKDVEDAIGKGPSFCPSYALRLEVFTSFPKDRQSEYEAMKNQALAQCPNFTPIYEAHLRNLLPRWNGSNEKMRQFIDESIKANSEFKILDALYLAEDGDQLRFQNQNDAALSKYNEALTHGNFAGIYLNRGLVLENLQRYVEALNDYETAAQMTPYNANAYEGMARILLKQGNPVGALAALSYLTTLNNQNPYYLETQGDIHYGMRRYEDALIAYKLATVLSSNKAIHKHKMRMAEFQISVRKNEKPSTEVKTAI